MSTELERLYREHRAGLVRLVERELRDRHEAEDAVQTAFLDAQRALERGTTPRNPRAWLAAIALNAARRLRRRRLNAEPLEDYAVHEAVEISDVRAALTSLPEEQRAAVLYRDVLGLSYGETAEQMGKSVNAVTMLLHRGRRRLRQTLGVTVGGVGSWRWLKQAGMPQTAVVKGAAGVLVAAGLATTGIVAARVVAPVGTNAAVAKVTRSGSPTAGALSRGAPAIDLVRRQIGTAGGSRMRETGPSMRGSGGDAATGPGRSSTARAALRLPNVSLPALRKLPATVAATVTVATPITTVTVSTPTGTTATVTTPITTVTVPLP